MAVRMVRKLKLSKEGRVGSQMAWSIRWHAVSHFLLSRSHWELICSRLGCLRARPLALCLGILCACFNNCSQRGSDVLSMVREKNCQISRNAWKVDGQGSARKQQHCVSHLHQVTYSRPDLGPGRTFRLREMLPSMSSVCEFGVLECLDLLVLYQICYS